MSETQKKIPRPTGLPVRITHNMLPPPTYVCPPHLPKATRRGSLIRPAKEALRLSSMVRGVKSVQDIAALGSETTFFRKTASYTCLKSKTTENGKTEPAVFITAEDTEESESKTPSVILMADCQRVLQSLKEKDIRNSSEFDDSVASLLSENVDLLDVRLDISVASRISGMLDRTPSVEDLPMECEPTTPGQVISALSLDTGYQGDGELSRPESRNAESESRIIKAQDEIAKNMASTMTDSDFFTESDADCIDEAGQSRRRDRKAQVIDGTLYGGPSERSQAEDMESSGIYSDLERKPDPPSYQELISQQIKTIQNMVTSQKMETAPQEPAMVKSSSGDSSTTILETPTIKVLSADSVKKDTVRKNKMPNRNVESKLKALLACEAKPEAKPRTPKRGKWDAVMDKIAAGREKQPTPGKFREVKSKVFQAVNGPRGSGRATPTQDASKARSRRSTRVRSSESSLVSPKSKQARSALNSINSSPHSSLSDVSVSSSHQRAGKKREGALVSQTAVNASTREIKRPRDACLPAKGTVPANNNNNINKVPVPRRANTLRPTPNVAPHNYPLKDVNQNGVVSKSISTSSISKQTPNNKTKTASRPTKTPSTVRAVRTARDPLPELRRQLAHSGKAVEVLGTLLNYCTHDLDAFSTPTLRKDLDAARLRVASTQEELDNYKSSCQRLEQDVHETQKLLEAAKAEGENLQLSLDAEQKRFVAVQEELKTSQNSCRLLEKDLIDAKSKLNSLEAKELDYQSRIKQLSEISVQFEQVLSLKQDAEKALQETNQVKLNLEQILQDKECEVKLISADNAKLRDKISRLSDENKSLKGKHLPSKEEERSKPLDVKWVESRNVAERRRLSSDTPGEPPCYQRTPSCTDTPEYSLQSEVESLRQVLALKTEEVSELHRLELHLKVEADRVPKLLSHITTLEAKVEDLQSQLSSQTEIIRAVNKTKETLQEELKAESAQKTRLSHKNEELQYKLRVNSEAMWQLVNRSRLDDRSVDCPSITSSPKREDSRPQMVGVVQKSDSVSYMLDIGEDTTEIVSNMVRRAETARSQTLPKKKRARTLGSDETPASEYYSCADSGSSSPAVTPRRPTRSRACVRLLQTDFATDSIELPREADCEVIEITGSFDRAEPDMSSSTSSNSSSNFDIESEVYADSPVMGQYSPVRLMEGKRLDPEGQDMSDTVEVQPPLTDDVFHAPISSAAAGEAMVSSDEE